MYGDLEKGLVIVESRTFIESLEEERSRLISWAEQF
jgi:hypothetical protein